MKPFLVLTLCGLASSACAQSITYSVVLSTPGPIQHGAVVQGTLRCAWQDPAGIGYALGAFRLRMDGLSISDVLSPNEASRYFEPSRDTVGVPADQFPPGSGFGTIADRWTSARRPRRGYLQNSADPTSLQVGGGFRFPPVGSAATDLHYSVETQSGATYLTARNGAKIENRIQHAQIWQALLPDPLFFEPAATLDLFKFVVRAPLSGSGVATISPEVTLGLDGYAAAIYTSPDGALDTLGLEQIQVVGASFTYVPEPGAGALLGFALLFLTRRDRSHT